LVMMLSFLAKRGGKGGNCSGGCTLCSPECDEAGTARDKFPRVREHQEVSKTSRTGNRIAGPRFKAL
ncbi:hypothetical protein, partial [Allopontixanthobacter sp.]|uniref:hypothetical protein n=1 Tax=Allopontixanthobacter sp. TaxID=2906452 RepID=UPI002ABA6883